MLALLWRAFVYSFGFCWRNDPWGTVFRIVLNAVRAGTGFALALVSSSLANTVQAYTPMFGQGPVPRSIIMFVFLLTFVIAIMEVSGRVSWYVSSRWQQNMRFANRRELDNHFASLDVARIRSKEFDDLKRRIDELPLGWGVRIELTNGILQLFSALVSFGSFGIALILLEPLYAVILVVTSVPLMVYQFKDAAVWWQLNQDLMPMHKARSVLERPYRGVTMFVQAKLFNQFPWLRHGIDQNVSEVKATFAPIRYWSLVWSLITQLIAIVGTGIVFYLAIVSIWKPDGAWGTVVLVIPAVRAMSTSLEQFVEVLAEQWQSVQAVVLIEEEFLQLGPLLVGGGHDQLPQGPADRSLKLVDVSFAYPNDPEKEVLSGLTVTIPEGTKVAVIGENGSGKSTLMQLLQRIYDPTKGSVLLGGTALTTLSPVGVARYISALTQDYEVSSRKQGEEIASSRLGLSYDEARVLRAVQLADLEAVIAESKDGLATQIGVEFGGREFSGGQRQRIALARAEYALGEETNILLLDEAEAKLDPESAERVIRNVISLPNVTVLMVTHFVVRALDFDYVLVMEKGKIVEFGDPKTVAGQNGTFARLLSADTKRRGGE